MLREQTGFPGRGNDASKETAPQRVCPAEPVSVEGKPEKVRGQNRPCLAGQVGQHFVATGSHERRPGKGQGRPCATRGRTGTLNPRTVAGTASLRPFPCGPCLFLASRSVPQLPPPHRLWVWIPLGTDSLPKLVSPSFPTPLPLTGLYGSVLNKGPATTFAYSWGM